MASSYDPDTHFQRRIAMSPSQPPQDWPSPSEFQDPVPARAAYTGLAGFTSADEVRAVAGHAPTVAPFGTPAFGYRRLAIGILASPSTLHGRPPSRFPERYPAATRIREIIDAGAAEVRYATSRLFSLKERCLRIIHYASHEPDLLAQLERLTEIAGPNLDGFQLNIAWPPVMDLEAWSQAHPGKRIVIQVNSAMIASCGGDAIALTANLGRYHGVMTDVLFDPSGGQGKALDLASARAFLETFHRLFKDRVGIGVAGGLDAGSVASLAPLFRDWPGLSIDAEGRVRDTEAPGGLGVKARDFALRAFDVIPSSTR
jgi:hypothetical protein